MGNFEIDLNELLIALSLMLDMAENKPLSHGKRVAYIAGSILRYLGAGEMMGSVLHAGILHDIGALPAVFLRGSDGFREAEREDRLAADHHATLGWKIALELPVDERIPELIRYHHERWDGEGPYRLKGEEIPLYAQVIALADQFELKFHPQRDSLTYREEIRQWLMEEKGAAFHERVVEALLKALETDKLWFDLSCHDITPHLQKMLPVKKITIGIGELEKIARAFSYIIDKKSAFTHQHSLGVSEKAYQTALVCQYGELKARMLKVAGYLHDLGKLVVPNGILDKPGKLTPEEILVIRKHPYYTQYILGQVKGFEKIAQWASDHHENRLGTGYPQGLKGDQMTEESQIVAICDIHQALVEDRVYRKGLREEEALAMIERLVEKGYYEERVFKAFLKTRGIS